MSVYRLEGVGREHARAGSAPVRALDGVDLEIDGPGVTVLEGPSGSGKTTLLGLLAGLDRPTAGRVLFEGADLARMPEPRLAALRRGTFGFVFQAPNLLARLPVWANVSYPLLPAGQSSAERRARALELLERVGMRALADRAPEELSGGELQRAAFARALVGRPRVLFLDEPTSALDEETAGRLLALVAGLAAEGLTVVAASHDRRLAALARVRVRLAAGRVAAVIAQDAGDGAP